MFFCYAFRNSSIRISPKIHNFFKEKTVQKGKKGQIGHCNLKQYSWFVILRIVKVFNQGHKKTCLKVFNLNTVGTHSYIQAWT